MPKLPRMLLRMTALAGLSFPILAQTTGPQLTVGPGLIYTVASRTSAGISSSASFNAVAYFKGPGSGPVTVYIAAVEGSPLNVGYVYAVDLASGQVRVVAGIGTHPTPNPVTNLYCTAGTPAICPGDNGPAANAVLHEPTGLAVDNAGNLFIADGLENVIRRVDAGTGIITTFAGAGGLPALGNEGVPAAQAYFSYPVGIAFDAAGASLYIADSLNNRVRVIASNGITNTVAGTGTAGFNDGPASTAQLNQPTGVALDNSGNLYIADSRNNAIRRLSGGAITTFAGQGTARYTGDGGPATGATLNYPRSVALDAGGNLYIVDTTNNAIRKVNGDTSHTISTIAGNGTAGYSGDGGSALSALLSSPGYIIADAQNDLYIIDNQQAVREITSTAAPLTLPFGAAASPYPLTISNTGSQTLNVTPTLPSNFTAGSGGTCLPPPAATTLNPGASCTLPISFIAGSISTTGTLQVTGVSTGSSIATNVTLSQSTGFYFVPLANPCRVVDTRLADPNFGGGAFSAQQTRSYPIRNSNTVGCASAPIPANNNQVQAYSLNVTVVPQGRLDFLTVYPSGAGSQLPSVSTLNSYDGRTKANAVIVPAGTDPNGSISVYANNPTHVIVDINGYYVSQVSSPSTNNGQTPLAFYPLPPCRAVDTRPGAGLLGSGSPVLGMAQGISYPLAGVCGLPGTAQAYALNYTALPRNGLLGYLTTWPTGTPQPVVSTLNAPTGAVTANAAIVPAGTGGNAGKVSVFSTNDTDLIIDVAGYYAPPAAGGLALYNVTPCRAFDSRLAGSSPLTGTVTASENITSGSCSVPLTAQSYVLNATVIPPNNAPVGYLTAWGLGSARPVQSVLNAYDGAVTSNLAVVPTFNGYISTYAPNSTGLLLDLSAYFAP